MTLGFGTGLVGAPFRVLLAALGVIWVLAPATAPARADSDAFVGMHIQGMNETIAQAMGREGTGGVLVRDVALGGPADRAGFMRGDLITQIDGTPIQTLEQLVAVLQKTEAGHPVAMTVSRADGEVTIELKTEKKPAPWKIKRGAFAKIPEAGVTLSALTQTVRQRFGLRWGSIGVLVTLVDPNKSGKVDLRRGDIIVQVNQRQVWDPRQVMDMVKKAKQEKQASLLILVESADGFRFALLPVK